MKGIDSPLLTIFLLLIFVISIPFSSGAQKKAFDLYEEAREHFYNGNHEQALAVLRESLTRKKFPEAYFLESMIYEESEREMQAIRSLSNLIELESDHLDAYFKRGVLYYGQGIYMQAMKDFDYILNFSDQTSTNAVYFQVDPNQQEQVSVTTLVKMKHQVYSLRGLTHQAIGEYDNALEDLTKAISEDSSAQNHINRALLFMELNQMDRAKQDLMVATSLKPNLVIGWYDLLLVDPDTEIPESIMNDLDFIPMISYQAVEAFQNEEYTLAKSLFTKALSINPNNPLLLVNAGRLSYKLGNYDDAIGFYRMALKIEPTKFEVYYLIGNSFFQKKEFTQAAAFYEQFLARNRSDGNVWYNAALTYLELDDKSRACECLHNAVTRGMEVSTSLLRDCNQ